MRVGFIGLGTMGAGMASNLAKAGYELVVHDARKEAAEPFLNNRAVWAESPKELAELVDVTFLSLPGPAEVQGVAGGHEGLVEGMFLGPRYTWSFFDSGYLLDRWRAPSAATSTTQGVVPGGFDDQLREFEQAFGGRIQVIARKKKVLTIGAEYGDASQPERADLMVWLTVPTVEYKLNAFWRNRSGKDRWR